MAGCEAISTCHGIVELVLRGVCLVLSILSIVSASVYFGALAELCNSIAATHTSNPKVVVGSCGKFSYEYSTSGFASGKFSETVSFDVGGSVGWVLVLSLVFIACQILAILQFFLSIEVLNAKKVICKTIWTIYSLVDLIVLGVISFGYLCGGVATTQLANGDWNELPIFYKTPGSDPNIIDDYNVKEVYTKLATTISNSIVFDICIVTSAFAYILMLVCIGMIVYFLVAKFVFKWPTHGAEDFHEEEILP